MKKGFLVYIIKRITVGLLGVLSASSIAFLAIKIIPGNPFLTYRRLPPEQMNEILKVNGYKEPLIVQLFKNLWNCFLFICISPINHISIVSLIFTKPDGFLSSPFFTSLKISIITILISLFFGILIGSLMAVKKNYFTNFIEKITTSFSTPTVITANITVVLVKILFKESHNNLFMNLFLPSIIFSLPVIYQISQYTKELMLETLSADYIKMLNLKGLSSKKIFFKHVLLVSIIPTISRIFSLFVNLLSTTFLIESVFGIPGTGNQLSSLTYKREYEGIVFLVYFFSLLSITSRIIDDIIFVYLNPKSKLF